MTNNLTLLLIHGFPLSSKMWQPAIASLNNLAACRILAPNLRGFGESGFLKDSHEEIVTMSDFADDLLKLCREENTERIIVVGLSMGGYVAMEIVRRAVPELAGLILCDTKATADTASMAVARRELAADLISGNKTPADIADAMLPKLVSQKTLSGTRDSIFDDDALLAAMRDILRHHNPLGLAAAARGMAERRDATDLLASLDLPILVLCGEDDALSPPDEMQRLAKSLRRSTFTTIPDAGHLSPWEQPDIFAEAVAGFLKDF